MAKRKQDINDVSTPEHEQAPPGPLGPDEYGDAGGPVSEVDPDAIMDAADDLARLAQEVEDWKAKYQRALADQQNYQRRAVENEKEARRQGISNIVHGLLPVLDNFDLALDNAEKAGSLEQIVQGVEMIRTQMHQALEGFDVKAIRPEAGDEFDPHHHEAVQHIEHEEIEPGKVAVPFQVGYALGGRVLRPAKVCVAKPKESAQSADDPSAGAPSGEANEGERQES